MKAIKVSILAIAMLTAGNIAVKAQTADEIMDKREAALGGKHAWDNITSLKMVGSINQMGNEIGMTQTILVGKAARTDISFMGANGYQIVTKDAGWSYMPMMGSDKVDTMKPEQVKASWEQMDVKSHQLASYKDKGGKAELDGRDTISNMPCYRVKVTDKDGDVTTYYIDVNTYYTLRTEGTVKIQGEEQEVATNYSDYQKLPEGIVMPMAMKNPMMDLKFKSIEVNKPIDESIFKPETPAAPKK